METGQIPACYRIYAGQTDGEQISLLRNTLTGSRPGEPAPVLNDVSGNVQQVCCGLGHVFVVVHASFVDGLALEEGIDLGEFYDLRLWPLLHPVFAWPRLPILETRHIEYINKSVDRLYASDSFHWAGDLPE